MPKHPDLPIRFVYNDDGTLDLATVEQDSIAEIENCVEVILRCPLGWRDELPEFGTPSVTYSQMPVDPTEIRMAIQRWESRVDVDAQPINDRVAEAIQRIRINLDQR